MYKAKYFAILAVTFWLAIIFVVASRPLVGQAVGALLQGTIQDTTGAVIPGAAITVTNMETNIERTAISSSAGLYVVPNLPPGRYRVQVSMTGFQSSVRENVELAVGQELVLKMVLQVGEMAQTVTVTGEAPLVNTSTAQVSGLVGERQVKDLPLNGRSFDNLITLNPGTVNFTSMKTGTTSSTGPGNSFSVSGRRPGENLFLMNGIEYPGGSGAGSSSPGGASGQLLGIDAVREFNVVQNIDSAEYGHRAGGQINVVTSSGTNSFHGAGFEFLRNSDLDARNFFDQSGVPAFRRNQFGGAAGGPIQKDKTFIFGNYEGFRQRLGVSTVAVVPDLQARQGLLPNAQGVYQPVAGFSPAVVPYFALWPLPNARELLSNGLPTGTALAFSNPKQMIQEDFGTVRGDRTFSQKDSFSAIVTIDNGGFTSPSTQNPFSLALVTTRAQLVSLSEVHIVSPNAVNSFTAGFSRINYYTDYPVSINPPGTQPSVAGLRPTDYPDLKIGGAQVGASAMSIAGSGPGLAPNTRLIDNIFTYSDQFRLTRGIHSLALGVWFERLQANERSGSYGNGQFAFSNLASFLQGKPSTLTVGPQPLEMPWRSWMGAWFVQDSMQLRPNLTLSLGLRHEFTNGWNALSNRAANYLMGPGGIPQTLPQVGSTIFTQNNAHWLLGPRAGIAWDPFGKGKTSITAGYGIAYSFLDNIGYCCDSTLPANTAMTFSPSPAFPLPAPLTITAGAPLPPGAKPGGGSGSGIQSDAQTPTIISYRFSVEQELIADTSVRVAYVGARGYHALLASDANSAFPVICSTAAGNCPAGLANGTPYFPLNTPRRNPNLGPTQQFFSAGLSYYNSLQVDLNRRFRKGLAFRANYTFSKSIDDASGLSSAQAGNEPSNPLDPLNWLRDIALSAYDVRHRFVLNGSYELPFGPGKTLFGGTHGAAGKIIGGWQLNAILSLQSGFPLTPQLGFNQSRSLDGHSPDRPDMAPGRTLAGIYLNTPQRWFDPTAFALPLAGTYGNVGRNVLIGPGLADFDLSLFKTTNISERVSLQFRAEFFNLLNHSNFGLPSPIVLTTSGQPASSAGLISSTSTTSRQLQFGLKLIW